MTAKPNLKTDGLSAHGRAALTNAGTSRQGATIPTHTENAVRAELMDRGLIGPELGLTRAGGIVRDKIQTEDLDRYF